MKFKDLVQIVESNYTETPKVVNEQKKWDYEGEFETPEGIVVVRINAEYSNEVVDHIPGYSDRGDDRDVEMKVPSSISDYEVVMYDENGNELPLSEEAVKKHLENAWEKFSQDPDYWQEISSGDDDYDDDYEPDYDVSWDGDSLRVD